MVQHVLEVLRMLLPKFKPKIEDDDHRELTRESMMRK